MEDEFLPNLWKQSQHPNENKTVGPDLEFKGIPLLNSQTIRLCDNRDNIDNFAELLHDNNVNRTKRVACRVDKIQATVDTRVLDVAIPHCGQFLAEIGAVLVFDVFDYRVPA